MPRSSGSGQHDSRSSQGESRNSSQSSGKSEKGLASASKATRERVAKKGGESSHGGQRSSSRNREA